jgi:excisionase family DNA binding protein
MILVYSSYLKISEKTRMAELLSIQEVAQITGLHEITIRRYVRSGALEAVRIGRRIRVRREAVDKLMKPMRPESEPEPALQSGPVLKEGAAAYEVTSQGRVAETVPEVVGRIALQLVQLPAEDISAVAQLVARLRQQRQPAVQRQMSPAEIVAAARTQAALLADVPRAEVAARFEALVEEIRHQAIAKNTAIEGDWLGD